MTLKPGMFGSPKMMFSATRHLGNEASHLSQIKDGKWSAVADYDKHRSGGGGDARAVQSGTQRRNAQLPDHAPVQRNGHDDPSRLRIGLASAGQTERIALSTA